MPAFVIARLTFLEAIRRRIALAALVLGVAFLVLYGLGFYFLANQTGLPRTDDLVDRLLVRQVYNFLTSAGLYAVNFLTIAMGALVSADTLAGEIDSGTIQAVVTRPIRRAEVVLGKWLGFAGLLALYLFFMAGGLLATVYALVGYSAPNTIAGVALIYLEALLVMSVTVALSSTLSTLATGGAIFGLYGLAFIGGWVEQVGAAMRNQTVVNIGIVSSLLFPSEALFRRAAFEMTPPLVQEMGINFGPMFVISVPGAAMILYAALFTGAAFGLAVRQFSRRDL